MRDGKNVILIIDDDADIREMLTLVLEKNGYEVEAAVNAEEGLRLYTADAPDLIIVDLQMPDIDGITLLREWSAGGTPECPVVVMSGHGNLETAVEATRLGAHDFVQKPLSLAKLLATVKNALDSHQSSPASTPPRSGGLHMDPIGNSPQMQLLRQKAEQASRHSSPILIAGEPGSGKETTAAFIHRTGAHAGRFVVLDHFQLSSTDIRSYLFGSTDGSQYTPGLLGQARNGTLFIPELQQLSMEAQDLINLAFEAGSSDCANDDKVDTQFVGGITYGCGWRTLYYVNLFYRRAAGLRQGTRIGLVITVLVGVDKVGV